MRIGFLVICWHFFTTAQAQLYPGDCKTYIDQVVFLERIEPVTVAPVRDSSNPSLSGIVCTAGSPGPSYSLRPADSSFQIISFIVSGDTMEDDIVEAVCKGSDLGYNGLSAFRQIRPGADVYFYCIRAVHTNGKEYTLKPFSIKR